MIKRQHTFYGAIGLFIGIVGGIAGTAFSMGAEQQRIKDNINTNKGAIVTLQIQQETHRENRQKEMDRYAEIIAAQMTQLQTSISTLTTTVGDLRTDVQVLKALMERMEEDLKTRANSG